VPVKEIPVVWSDKEGSTLHALRDGPQVLADLRRLANGRLA
jgi:hypothetical protein